MRLVMVTFVVGVLAGCHPDPAQQREIVSTAICDCSETLPSKVDACIAQVDPLLPPTVSEDCLNCVYENSQQCTELFAKCIDLCFPNTP